MSLLTKRKKPYRKAAIYPNFPYLYDTDEPDEVFRFRKHQASQSLHEWSARPCYLLFVFWLIDIPPAGLAAPNHPMHRLIWPGGKRTTL